MNKSQTNLAANSSPDLLPALEEITEKSFEDSISQRVITEKTKRPQSPKREEVTGKMPAKSVRHEFTNKAPTHAPLGTFWHKLKLTLGMIKVQHSLFALPFALTSLLIATHGSPTPKLFVLVVLAMITARNTAMTFNRIVDRDIDQKNPRTMNREIPSGKLSLSFAKLFCAANVLLFIVITGFINKTALALSPLALAIVLSYSLTKRFTHYTQFFLGLALGIAPIAAWIAATGTLALFPILLGLGVLFWVSGFDLIYSTLDYDFDKTNGLKNLVVKWGIKKSLWAARVLHLTSMMFIFLAGAMERLSLFYFLGGLFMTGIIAYEHKLIKPHDLSRVNMAFFTLNGYAALVFLGFVLLETTFKLHF